MASKKVTVTLPEEVVARSTELARRAGLPLSTWLARAAEHQARIEDGLAAMREWEQESGLLTPEEVAQADAQLARADAELLAGEHAAG